MADAKISALTNLTAADAINDMIPIVDVSDTPPASGNTKRISINNLLSSSPTASGALTVTGLVTAGSATITGALVVDTTTLVVDSTNNRVGIGTATPGSGYSLDIVGAAVGGIRVSSNNYPNLVIDSANSNGALIYFQEGGTTQARIGHLTGVTGLEFSGNNGTAATNVHYGIDATGVSTWKNVGGVAGTAMTLNSTGLGVGTASPGYKLVVAAASGNVMQFENTSDSSRGGRITNTGTAGTGKFGLTTTSSGYGLSFGIDAVEKMLLDTSNNLNITSGNVVMATSGKGIDFSATASGSGTMTSELLNDYEEGTWVGTLTGGTTNPTIAVTATGRYTKIGRVVTVQIYFNNVNTVGASGLIGITGLPFACNASNGSSGAVSFYNLATFTGSPFVALGVNESFLNCYSNISSSAFGNVTHNAGASGNYLTTSVTYTVA